MKFVLNMKKGTTINHPAFGKLQGGVAYQVEDNVANQMKHIINVLVFDEVVFRDEEKEVTIKEDKPKRGKKKK